MKETYDTATMSVETYATSTAIGACTTVINSLDSNCVKKDPDATTQMKDLAWSGYFTEQGNCTKYADGMSSNDGICYHTNLNAAFNS